MRRYIWLLLLVLWGGLLIYPWPGLPPLANFLLYPLSPLQIDYAPVQLEIPGSPQPGLKIRYDQRGVPYLFAPSDTALAFGMGYVHAKDRLFQLEMLRRTVRGRLSEVAGAKALPSDRWWLKFAFEKQSAEAYQKTQREYPALAAQFAAYARGFNHYLKNLAPGEKPVEFHLLGFEPTPMQPYAPIMLVRYMDKVLNYNENDLQFSALASRLPDSLIRYYYPWNSPYAFATYPERESAAEPTRAPEAIYALDHDFSGAEVKRARNTERGSNNWAVAAKRSASGHSLLCNDTHLGLDLPGTWYEVHQVVGDKRCHGFSIPGAPYVISGTNGDVAWGMTNATWDLVDFFQLETNAQGQYRLDGQWTDLEERSAVIPVKGAPADTHRYYHSHFGPVDSLHGYFLATDWVASDFSQPVMLALDQLNRAESLEEASAALARFGHPPQNFILSDRHGAIGLVTAGQAQIHPRPTRGVRPGRSRSDKVPFTMANAAVSLIRPSRGWLHSANHHQRTDSLAPYLNTLFAPSARGRQIAAYLQSDSLATPASMQALQGQLIDGEWPLLRKHILTTVPAQWRALFADWDGACTEESRAATLYNAYKWELHRQFSQTLLGEFDFLPPAEHFFYLLQTGAPLPLPSGDSLDRLALAARAWRQTLEDLQASLGADTAQWTYRNFHRIHFRHLAGIEAFSKDPFGAPGSPRTVNVSSGNPATHGPSMRTVIELGGEEPKIFTVHASGQSGQPGHPHYVDQIDPWCQMQYFPIHWAQTPTQGDWAASIDFE